MRRSATATTPAKPSSLRRAASAITALALLVSGLGAGLMSATAAPGDSGGVYYGTSSTGTSIRLVGESTNRTPRAFGLNSVPSGTTSTAYSLDLDGADPVNNTRYTEGAWPSGLATVAAGNQGPVEWILKNGVPESTNVQLGTAAGIASPTLTEAKARAATQAALWYYTNGAELDLSRNADIAQIQAVSGNATGYPAANLLTADPAAAWRSAQTGPVVIEFTTVAAINPTSLEYTSVQGGSAASVPAIIVLERKNPTTGAWTNALNYSPGFAGGVSETKTQTITAPTIYTARTTFRLTLTPADPSAAVELAGIRVNVAASAEYAYNDYQVAAAYRYLVAGAAGQQPSTATEPVVELSGRDLSAVAAGELVGPYTLVTSGTATLALSGADASTTSIVNAAGTPLSGAQPDGTQFYLRDTRTTPLAGQVTVTATATPVSSRYAITRIAAAGAVERASLSGLRTATFTAASSLAVGWTIDDTRGDTIDETGAATTRVFDYDYPLEQSPTEDTLIWDDGSTTTTDLFRLREKSPSAGQSANAYSIDFTRNALLQNRDYTEVAWAQGNNAAALTSEGPITWILSNSYPNASIESLTAAITAAEPGLSKYGNIKTWRAIAATQAAIWHFSDGKNLDSTRLGVPVAATVSESATEPGDAAPGLLTDDPAEGWTAQGPTAYIALTLPYRAELRSYTVTTLAGGEAANTPHSFSLQLSNDGVTWSDVSSSNVSAVSPAFTGGDAQSFTKNLGASATYGSSANPGYQYYRLVITAAQGGNVPVELSSVRFDTSIPSVNDPQTLALYTYLVDQAAGRSVPAEPTLQVTAPANGQEVAVSGLIGPLRTTGSKSVITVDAGTRTGVSVVDAAGNPLTGPLESGAEFYLTPGDLVGEETYDGATVAVTVTATGTYVNRVAARALNTSDGSQETLTVLGLASSQAVEQVSLDWRIAATESVVFDVIENEVQAGGVITVAGSGFRAGELVSVSSASVSAVSLLADADGVVAGSVPVPWDHDSATVRLTATGAGSGRSGSDDVAVRGTTAGISAAPSSVRAGERVTVSGTGFGPSESVVITLPGGGAGAATTTAAGSFSTEAIVPASLAGGQHAVSATGQASGRTASTSVTVTAVASPTTPTASGTASATPSASATPTITPSAPAAAQPSLSADRIAVNAGETVEVVGTGFAAGEPVQLTLHSEPVELRVVNADAAGGFTVVVTVPVNTAAGDHSIVATGTTTGRTASVALSVSNAGSATAADLAETGIELGWLAGGAGLIATGALSLLVVRQRRGVAAA